MKRRRVRREMLIYRAAVAVLVTVLAAAVGVIGSDRWATNSGDRATLLVLALIVTYLLVTYAMRTTRRRGRVDARGSEIQ